jgi:hypothetical protein
VRRLPASLVYPGVVVVVAAMVLAVWVLGGFDRRTDLLVPTAPGTTVLTGPYAFTFTKATAQRRKSYSGTSATEWHVVVVGTGRTTGDESITPSTLNPMFLSRDPGTDELQPMSGQQFGDGDSYSDGSSFTPGLAPVSYRVEFTYSERYRPGPTLRFAVFQLEYSDNTIVGTGEKTWNNTSHGYVFTLPVTVVPAQT